MPYTATLRGYPVGEACEWDWDGVLPDGIGPGDYRGVRQDRVGGDGSTVVGGDWAGANVLTFQLVYDTQPGTAVDVELAARRLKGAWAPERSTDLVELTVVLASGTYIVRGRPMKPAVDLSQAYSAFARAIVQFEATDPLWYSATQNQVSVTVAAAAGGGMTTPLVTPMVTTGSAMTGDLVIVNNGTADVPWTAIITGPITTPRLILDGRAIEISGSIAAGSTITVDSRKGRVTVDGAIRPWVSYLSDWWDIPPGSSNFSFRAVSGTGSVLLAWREASF